jgi:hypothetical protein
MAQGKHTRLSGGRELPYLSQQNSYLGSILRRIINSINTTAENANVASVGKLSPPDAVDNIQVQGTMDSNTNTITCPSEHLHFVITHNSALKKGAQYLSEIDTDPNFPQPHIIDHGASRSGFVHLPSFQNDGVTPQVYYLRSYAQYRGSDPGPITTLGGRDGATKIVMTGSSGTSLLPSTGSGTANPNGQQGGKGLGVVLERPAPGPKRNLKA